MQISSPAVEVDELLPQRGGDGERPRERLRVNPLPFPPPLLGSFGAWSAVTTANGGGGIVNLVLKRFLFSSIFHVMVGLTKTTRLVHGTRAVLLT